MATLAAGGAEQARDQAQHRQEDDRLIHQANDGEGDSQESPSTSWRITSS
ncbi:MAG TPA: hypothetical protein VNY27_00415 [Solirubrobacteraceae bacterium]|jgi:hypothetical protein|nr:hypothetical protein [Solirubrobacteraceae bacterium]